MRESTQDLSLNKVSRVEGENGTLADGSTTLPELQYEDVVFKKSQDRWQSPLVSKKYKLVFFPIPKVACSEWKLLFRRIIGLAQDPSHGGLNYLSSYSKEEAQEMLTSKEWTRAVFVREPKERILSAFLDKVLGKDNTYFQDKCCNINAVGGVLEAAHDCLARNATEDFSYFLKRTLDCHDVEWSPLASAIDDKWWRMMTFIGYMNNIAADAEEFLKSIKSSDGTTAWDEYGEMYWLREGGHLCLLGEGSCPPCHHNAKDIYTQCEEAFVEKHWAADWEHGSYHFDEFRYSTDDDMSNCTDMIL